MSSTVEIKAADVQKLRQMTGAGMMDCKQALADAAGNVEKAIQILREKGIAKSSKRADRVAAEGILEFWLSDSADEGILLELNSETDFVARNVEFVQLAKTILDLIRKNPSWTSPEQIPADVAAALSGKVGEKISARRFARFKASAGAVACYIHPGAKLGVLLQIDSTKPGASEDLKTLAKELALQVAGANPLFISRNDVPADVLEREKEITKKQMADQKKPPEIMEKIATGKLQQFFEANCLLEQAHVRDASGKTKINDLVAKVAAKDGVTLTVSRFIRFRVGAE